MTAEQAIDAFVTPLLWREGEEPEYMRELAEGLFRRDLSEVLTDVTVDGLLADMDAAGVALAVLNAIPGRLDDVAGFVRHAPDRFVLSAEVDPRRGMACVREIRAMVADHGLGLVRMVPFQIGLAPNHAAYFPVFAACVDLGVPVSLTTGMPGPPMPSEPQRPLHLDDVCRFFPELVLVMAHGADPWWDEAIRLMVKFPNLHLMTSDCAPRYLPASLIQYMNTRGRDKILFATGFPMLTFERCLADARALDLRPGVLDAYISGNAARVFGLEAQSPRETT